MNNIYHRVSIRKYENRPVEMNKTQELLKAAMAAPSAGNQQPWEFYVVTNRQILDQLAAVSPYAGMLKNAPAAIVTAYREQTRMPEYAQIDMAISMENMWLEADRIGLGGVMLGIAPLEERMTQVEKIAGIPEGQRAFAIFSYGYPAENRKQQDRFKQERIHMIE